MADDRDLKEVRREHPPPFLILFLFKVLNLQPAMKYNYHSPQVLKELKKGQGKKKPQQSRFYYLFSITFTSTSPLLLLPSYFTSPPPPPPSPRELLYSPDLRRKVMLSGALDALEAQDVVVRCVNECVCLCVRSVSVLCFCPGL